MQLVDSSLADIINNFQNKLIDAAVPWGASSMPKSRSYLVERKLQTEETALKIEKVKGGEIVATYMNK